MRELDEKEIPAEMLLKARALKEGKILSVYEDRGVIRMETEEGENTYVWRNNTWREMKLHEHA